MLINALYMAITREMVIMTNSLLIKSIRYEEFDYQTLLDSVCGYARPRMKISGMLAKGDIIRVKKGLYNAIPILRTLIYKRR